MKIKFPRDLNYNNVPGVKAAGKIFLKSLIRKLYVVPVSKTKDRILKVYVEHYRLPVEEYSPEPGGIGGLFLVASYTDADKGYVDGMMRSAIAFDRVILYHDKKGGHKFNYNESIRFQLLIAAAKRKGANWVLIGSPKTRFSSQFAEQIKPYIEKNKNKPTVLTLKERYLWGDFDHYAFVNSVGDGVRIRKLFNVTGDMVFDNKPIHASQCPVNYENIIDTPASRYYLGRFNIEAMRKKADFYKKKDGEDYSYLLDVSKPKKHNENILGIGEYEENNLL